MRDERPSPSVPPRLPPSVAAVIALAGGFAACSVSMEGVKWVNQRASMGMMLSLALTLGLWVVVSRWLYARLVPLPEAAEFVNSANPAALEARRARSRAAARYATRVVVAICTGVAGLTAFVLYAAREANVRISTEEIVGNSVGLGIFALIVAVPVGLFVHAVRQRRAHEP